VSGANDTTGKFFDRHAFDTRGVLFFGLRRAYITDLIGVGVPLNIWRNALVAVWARIWAVERSFSSSRTPLMPTRFRKGEGFGISSMREMIREHRKLRMAALIRLAGNDTPNGPRRDDGDNDSKTGIVTKTRPKTKKPSLYKVLLLNDDFTPMEFVVLVLQRFFNKGQEDATRIMLHVHHKGVGICGVYTYEVAETKVTQVMDFSRQHGHPLQCTMEKE
jgi:ATP-dependent Clp protease adaptor protein ClpS